MNPTEPIAVTTGYYGGQATVKALDESIVLPVGLALYPQPAQQGMAYAALMQSASDWICEHVPTGTRGATAWATKLQDAAHALRASHWQAPAQAAAPAQAGEYPALVCDYCGALTPDPWHSSGMLHGKMSKHIHSCDACCRGAAQAAPTAQVDVPESEYRRGYRHGYEQRDAEVRGALA